MLFYQRGNGPFAPKREPAWVILVRKSKTHDLGKSSSPGLRRFELLGFGGIEAGVEIVHSKMLTRRVKYLCICCRESCGTLCFCFSYAFCLRLKTWKAIKAVKFPIPDFLVDSFFSHGKPHKTNQYSRRCIVVERFRMPVFWHPRWFQTLCVTNSKYVFQRSQFDLSF